MRLTDLKHQVQAITAGAGTQALWLGPDAPAECVREMGWNLRAWQDADRLEFPDASFDVVLVVGCLGAYEWDRWLLQEVQRVLAPGGTLLVEAPNLFSLVAPSDWLFFLGRAAVQADRSMRKALRLPAREYPFRGRKYHIGKLLGLFPALGYTAVNCAPAPVAADARVREYFVRATRGPSLFGVEPSRPYPPAAEHRARYEGANLGFLATRSGWRDQHPAFRCEQAKELDPADYAGASVLVLAPHPDDEVIGCGGTLARMIRAGAVVTSLQATDGSEGAALREVEDAARRTIRLDEAAAVSTAIGFTETVFWRQDNAAFRCTSELVQRMKELLERVRPVLVFTPFVADLHPDHFTLNRILKQALAQSTVQPRIMQYEVWGLVPANTWCDVTEMSETLESLLRLYRTAMKVDDFVHFCEDRNLFHAIAHLGRPGLAEAFLESSSGDFVAVTAEKEAADAR